MHEDIIMTVQVKTGPSSFGGRKYFTGQTALFPSNILRKMQKQKNSQGSPWKPWAPPVMASTATSGLPAPVPIDGAI
jgi:hypothetical protein